ncbi:MAG: hypothetical protein GEV04_24120 [Actinophytocola sp.]|nr:hypothetical protein [Actinophytocola sp.]
MAGRRRAADGPRQAQLRLQRRLAQLQAELDSARTTGDRIAAAADYVRGAVKHADHLEARVVADELVQVLTDAGTRLLGGRKGPTR